jgi:NTE family protein
MNGKHEGEAKPLKVAIACQGGGSHTAFTAGALGVLLAEAPKRGLSPCALTGTSGGAICAWLGWQALLEGANPEADLKAFWRRNGARLPWERLVNDWLVEGSRLQTRGLVPELRSSPYAPAVRLVGELTRATAPRPEFLDLRALLEEFAKPDWQRVPVSWPRLLIGAVDVLSGAFKAFDSCRSEIGVEAVLASTTIPWLFPAVEVDGKLYWDGLFSHNPPICPLFRGVARDTKPDELWVIRVNPEARDAEPRSVEEIEDRRNELSGNLSLHQEIGFVEKVNDWISSGRLRDSTKKVVRIRWIAMEDAFARGLDYSSKLDRRPAFLEELMAHGRRQARELLRRL